MRPAGSLRVNPMTDPCKEQNGSTSDHDSEVPDRTTEDVPVRMTLEQIVDLTGELEHLNELIQLHLRKCGGFVGTESYFTTVQPVLDLLEIEIRFRYRYGMTKKQMTLIVQDWIDQEIAEIKKEF
jgi:hypothetical protein